MRENGITKARSQEKTGYTDEAHNTLVTAAKRNDMTLVCVVMLCDNLDYINDTRTLLDYGFNNFTHVTPESASGEEVSGMLTLPNGSSASDTTYSDTENGDSSSGNTTVITRQYYYNSQPVGTAQVTVTATPTPLPQLTSLRRKAFPMRPDPCFPIH